MQHWILRSLQAVALLAMLVGSSASAGEIVGDANCPACAAGKVRRGLLNRLLYSTPNQSQVPSGNPYTPTGLPMGRTYYNGRYFGNYNNLLYGPQYGYF